MAASNLLGVGETTLNLYISPTSAASKIQYAYRQYLIWRNRILLPCLRGPYKSWIGCTVATEVWAADMNALYRSQLVRMHRSWTALPLADLLSYLSTLRCLDVTVWLPMSSDCDTMWREYKIRMVLLLSWWKGWLLLDILGRPVSWLKFSSSGLPFSSHFLMDEWLVVLLAFCIRS